MNPKDPACRRRVVISGATGLIGSRLVRGLREGGYRVDRLMRSSPQPGTTDLHWNPAAGKIDAPALEGAEAVVHLAGENIGQSRWTPERKDRIWKSRVESTELLSRALASLKQKPKVLVSASAIGFYGDRGEEVVTEDSAPGRGFLAEVCRAWEAATAPARAAGIRVIAARFGMVLAGEGGALAAMLPAFRLGLGGPMGSGKQFLSWVALSDLVRIIHFLIETENLSGPIAAAAPNPVTNAEFAQTLAQVLHRPALFRLPASIIRLLFGEMGQALFLEGARIAPAKLLAAGFQFLYPDLEKALRHELRKNEIGT